MTDTIIRRWGIDLSGGTTLAAHWPEMTANGLSFAIFRAGEGLATGDNIRPQCELAIKYGVPFGLYFAIHPWYSADVQVNAFIRQAASFSAKCLVLDFELYEGTTPDAINQHYQTAYNSLKAKTTLPAVSYSGNWFIEAHAAAMKTWIGKDVYWDANYRQPFQPETWMEFHQQLADLYIPKYAGYPPVGIFQFAGDRPTAMIPHKVDYDLIDSDAVYQYLFRDGPRPAYLDAAPVVIAPPVDLVHYVVSNPTGTYIQTGAGWQFSPVQYVKAGVSLYIDATWQQVPGWVKVTSPVSGYASLTRIKQVTP